MSDGAMRESTLEEYVGRLSEYSFARKEYEALKAKVAEESTIPALPTDPKARVVEIADQWFADTAAKPWPEVDIQQLADRLDSAGLLVKESSIQEWVSEVTPALDKAIFEFDGHSPADVANRLESLCSVAPGYGGAVVPSTEALWNLLNSSTTTMPKDACEELRQFLLTLAGWREE